MIRKVRLMLSAMLVACMMLMSVRGALAAIPAQISLQGKLQKADGSALLGNRKWQVTFFDAATTGTQLGAVTSGTLTLSAAGRFSLALVPPAEIMNQSSVYYQLGIDSAAAPDGTIDTVDVFPTRVQVNSVPFAINAAQLGGTPATGYARTSDLAGLVAGPTFWKLGGNDVTSGTQQFIGPNGDQPFEVHLNGKRALQLTPEVHNGGSIYAGNVVLGHSRNSATGAVAGTIGGGGGIGSENAVSDYFTTVSGGASNSASNQFATVSGGGFNRASSFFSTVGGGYNNQGADDYSTVGGGQNNQASGADSTVGGGASNTASEEYATVGGGTLNQATGQHSVVAGGVQNTASGLYSTIAGGLNNRAFTDYTAIGGGKDNVTSGTHATVAGGLSNQALGEASFVGGGSGNTANGENSTLSGGAANSASGPRSTVSGGLVNFAFGELSVIGGGSSNSASGKASTVPGGNHNAAAGEDSFAAGNLAHADHQGTFVWADSTPATFASTSQNQFLIRATGGVGINKNNPTTGTLDVAGSIAFTGDLIGKAVRTERDGGLRVIRGIINQNGTIFSGEGFTSVRNSVGNYTINYSSAFSAFPNPYITPSSATTAIIPVISSNGLGFTNLIFRNTSNALVDPDFIYFIVIGP